ncbi:unnamed protein product [Phytophthora fragariaefolia]|uniref:Unnamed protein product n=1 Tax=Phytophthora fragariaefolia TaxID=1490495 RepID=A0A9W6U1W3_9STRA|nr:unnamed protein product [Phytophthora fragariaefolia]
MRAIHLSSAFFLALAAINAGAVTVTAISCADRVSTGDQSVGITAVEDASCATGGLGCFPDGDQCRFCSPSNSTSEITHLMLCSEVPVSGVSSSEPNTNTQLTEATTTSTTTGPKEAAIDCVSLVSTGDQGVGISAMPATSPTCAENGLGCFQRGQCRFCQSRQTTQSAPYMKCSRLGGGSTSTNTPSTPPSSAPYTPPATVASTSTSCSTVVSRSGLQGISYITEPRCNVASPTLLGCSARTSCRLCRDYKDEANQYLISCVVLKNLGATESAAAGSFAKESGGAVDTADQSLGKLTVTTEVAGVETATTTGAATIGVVAAIAGVVAVLVVVMMSVMYVKSKRDPLDDIMTPDDCPGGDLMTPHGGRGYTPREGSLVMVVSQSSIATL